MVSHDDSPRDNTLTGDNLQDETDTHTPLGPEPPTNGLENIVDWSRLEDMLDAGEFTTKGDFEAEVRRQFDAAGVEVTNFWHREVVAGLLPEYREKHQQLPRPNASKLNPDRVRQIRSRSTKGESLSKLATAFGVTKMAISNIVNRRAWKEVA